MRAKTPPDRSSDLTVEEQGHVRKALRFLRARCGDWGSVAKALRFGCSTVASAAGGHRAISASMAMRVARLSGVNVDEVLSGRFPPPGTCPYCGHRQSEKV
jgi:hypothetical protein